MKMINKKSLSAYLFLTPFLVFFFLFMIFPFFWVVTVSLFRGDVFSPMQKFVGLYNYLEILSDSFFWVALENTCFYVVLISSAELLLALCFALWILSVRGRTFFRMALILPFFCPPIIGGFMWRWMFYYDHGLINAILQSIGLQQINWLGPAFALPVVAGMEIWRAIGYYTLIYIAGLSSIPSRLYDAALVDGVNAWQRFRYITLPLLKPCLTFISLMSLIWSFQIFDSVWIITGGGPANKSSSLTYYIFLKAFRFQELGHAIVASFVLMMIILATAITMMRFLWSELEF